MQTANPHSLLVLALEIQQLLKIGAVDAEILFCNTQITLNNKTSEDSDIYFLFCISSCSQRAINVSVEITDTRWFCCCECVGVKVCVQLWSALVNFLLFDHYLAKHECPSLHFQLHFTVCPTGPKNAFWLASSDVPHCGTALFFYFYYVSPSLVPLSSSFSLCLTCFPAHAKLN